VFVKPGHNELMILDIDLELTDFELEQVSQYGISLNYKFNYRPQ